MRASVHVGTIIGVVCLAFAGCEGESREGLTRDGENDLAAGDVTLDTALPELDVERDGVAGNDGGETQGCDEAGGLSCPCTQNGECNSGVCVPSSSGGSVCSRTCVETCPDGSQCKAIALGGSDPTFICVERTLNLCRPCRATSDCSYPGFSEPGDRCVDTGEEGGAFCGNACVGAQDCPTGYECAEVETVGSDERTMQCRPVSGECGCTGRAVIEAADTVCRRGACEGRRVCESDGLSACDAAIPEAEVCDGVDNDCSGQVDEGFPDLDQDQVADCVDPDDDGDGVDDAVDVCPSVADGEQLDGDGDGVGDACDAVAMPVMVGTEPGSPANGVNLDVIGSSEVGTAVALYDDANCTNERGREATVGGGFRIAAVVPVNSSTTFWGRAFNGAGQSSACSNTSVTYVEDSLAPALPSFVGTTPSSPSQTILSPIVTGLAEARSTVRLYAQAGCIGAVAAETETGGQGVFLASVTVEPGTTTVFYATATDAAGNVSGCTPQGLAYTHIVGPIETYITSGPSDPSTATTATFWFIANVEGATFTCRLGGAMQSGVWSSCTSPATFGGLANGDWTFEVAAVNPEGVTDPTPARFEWVIDTTPPQTTIVGMPGDPSNDPTPTFTFTVNEALSTTVCRIDSQPFVSCISPWTAGPFGDGAHTIYILATDAAGNREPVAASYSWRIDTDPPETTLSPVGLNNPSAVGRAEFSLGSDEPGTFVCRLDGAVVVCPTSGTNWVVSGLGDGAHMVEVAAVDHAGNADPTPATYLWISDTVAPDTFFVGALPQANSSETQVTFAFGSNDALAAFECELNGSWSGCTTPLTLTLGSGSWTLRVRAVDPAGNRDASPVVHTFVIDANPPDTTITARPPNLHNQTTASFSFTSSAPDVAGYRCRVDGGAEVNCTSPFVVSGLAQNGHTFSVAAVDTVGNVDPTPATASWTVDSIAPLPPTGLVAVGGNRQATLTWNQVADAVRYRVSYSNGVVSIFETTSAGAVVSPLANCVDWTFEVMAIDQAGNVSAPSTPATARTVLPVPGYDVVGGHGLVNVRLDVVTHADAYRVYYGSTAGGPYVGGASSSGGSPIRVTRGDGAFAMRGLPPDDEVFVVVTALDGTCESARGPEWKSKPYPWAWVSPTPTGNSLRGVTCFGGRCVAVGNVGTVLGGNGVVWTRGNGGTGDDFVDVAAVDGATFVAVAGSTIHRSDDAGSTFEPVMVTSAAISKVRFAGPVGWAVGAGGLILNSIDGGETWVEQDSTTSGDLYAVWAVSANQAWAGGVAGKLLVTYDGGSSWSSVDGPTIRTLRDVVCNAQRCLAAGDQGTLLEYDPAQMIWSNKVSNTGEDLARVVILSNGNGLAVGSSRAVVSESGGTWSATTKDLGLGTVHTGHWFGLAVFGGGALVAGEGGAFGRLVENEGAITSRVTGADLRGIAGSGQTSVAVGDQAILRTTDGVTWAAIAGASGRTMYDVAFASASTVFAVGSGGGILKSVDGGSSFALQTSNETETMRGISCIDANRCWAGGDSETMRKTTDGATWSAKLGVYGTNAVTFTDMNNGFLVVDNRYVGNQYTGVLYSIDGGDTWTSYQNYSTGRGLAMSGASSGFYAGNSGSNYCQEKAGLSSGGGGVSAAIFELVPQGNGVGWSTALSAGIDYAGDCFYGVIPRVGGKAFAAGTQGLFGRDLGARGWVQLPPPTRERDLFDLRETAPGTVVAVGERGTIMRTVTGGL